MGVPCSELKDFVAELQEDSSMEYVPCTCEKQALGLAVGAYLAGKKPLVYMQNSGFGDCLDMIASLLIPHCIPVHFLVSLRSKPWQHEWMFKITQEMFLLLDYREVTFC